MAGVPLVMVANRRMAFGGPALPLKRLTKHVRRFFGQWERFEPELARVEDDLPWIEVAQDERTKVLSKPDLLSAAIKDCVEDKAADRVTSTTSRPFISNPIEPLPMNPAPSKSAAKHNPLLDRPGFWRTCVAVWAVLLLLFAGGYFLTGATGESTAHAAAIKKQSAPLLGYWTDPATGQKVPYTSQAIETIKVGQKVLGHNPIEPEDIEFGVDVDQRTWRKLVLLASKIDQTTARIEMLRPVWWIEFCDASPGNVIHIDVPDCGISGAAQVLEVLPCPQIAEGPGRIVTATYAHQSVRILDLEIEGISEKLGTTANHPFWSVDQEKFVPAGELKIGERLLSKSGPVEKHVRISSITPRGPPESVYNLEVQGCHTYYVTTSGILVHNGTGCTVTPWGTKDNTTGKFVNGPRGGVDPVKDFNEHAVKNGYTVLGTEVSVNTPFGRRKYDTVLMDSRGNVTGVEIKSTRPEFEKRHSAQEAKDRYVNEHGSRVLGEKVTDELLEIRNTIKILWEVPSP